MGSRDTDPYLEPSARTVRLQGDTSAATFAALPPPPPAGPVPAGASAIRTSLPPPRRRKERGGLVLAAVGAGVLLLALLLWLPGRHPVPGAPKPVPGSSPTAAPTPGGSFLGPLTSLLPQPPGRLRIDFDHPLRAGHLRVFVDDELALEEALSGQPMKKALVFKRHEGSFRDELEVPPGLREVRVEVRWDDNLKTARIVGNCRPGATRRLEASLGRLRRDLNLEWK